MRKTSSIYTSNILIAVIVFCCKISSAQNVVNVDLLTGAASVTIPIHTVKVGDIATPVLLSYRASGLKVEDYDNRLGMGWRLVAEGSITREVRGFPDDAEIQNDAAYGTIKGWLRPTNTAPQAVQTFTVSNTTTSNTCPNEITDVNTISSSFPYALDAEPDMFSVNAPGLNCNFVFDATTQHLIKTIPYKDYKIIYAVDGLGKIISFTVTNESGIKYYFDIANSANQYISALYNNGASEIDPLSLEIFKKDFLQYRTKAAHSLSYNDKWMLSKMEDIHGNTIVYQYNNSTYPNPEIQRRIEQKPVEILKPNGTGGFIKKTLYTIINTRVELRLVSISKKLITNDAITTDVEFGWISDGTGTNADFKLNKISIPNEKTDYDLIYTKSFKAPSNAAWNGWGRYFLKGINLYNNFCVNSARQFNFSYYGVDEVANTCYCTPTNGGGLVVDTLVNMQDYWGYYNAAVNNANLDPTIWVYTNNTAVETFKLYPIAGYAGTDMVKIPQTPATDRSVNAHAIDGTIKRIILPTGGITELEYENNEFYDKDMPGTAIKGAGIRVKKITSNDGLNTNEITSYEYNDPVTAQTTGRAISVPKFTIPFLNTNSYATITDRVNNSLYRTTYDLNLEAKDILYGKVTVKKTNGGKSVYEYNTTGTYSGLPATDWLETINYVSRTGLVPGASCVAIVPTFLNSGTLKYPFSANNNFDFERGLPLKVSHYNETGDLIARDEFQYSRSHTAPAKIYGLNIDDIGNTIKAYGKYTINTVVDNFTSNKISKLFNLPNPSPYSSTYKQETETYTYTPASSSLSFRVLKQVSKQNSDGTTMITENKYAKEYTTTAGGTGGDMDKSLFFLINANNNSLIESSQSRQDASGTKIIGATLNTSKGFAYSGSGVRYLPEASYKFINQAGIASFVFSTVNSSTGVFTKDVNYTAPPMLIEAYSDNNIPQLVSNAARIPKTIISAIDYELKTAEFSNARPENVVYANFDLSNYPAGFNLGSNTANVTGHASTAALAFQPSTTINTAAFKNAPFAGNIILSFWCKNSTGTAPYQNIRIRLIQQSNSAVVFDNTLKSFTGNTEWKYNQYIISNPSYGTSNFYTLYLDQAGSVSYNIDDILVYPDNAAVTTNNYTSGDFLSSVGTNFLTGKFGLNGVGSAYEYDASGRPWLVRDQLNNITEIKKYKNKNNWFQPVGTMGYNNNNTSGYSTLIPVINMPLTFSAGYLFSFSPPIQGDCSPNAIAYTWNFGDGTPIITTTNATTNHTYTVLGKYQITVTISSPGLNSVTVQTPPVTNTSPNPLPFTVVNAPPPPAGGGGTPVICAAGIIQRTDAGQCILSACTGLPSDCGNTYFKLTGVTGGSISNVMEVTWEISGHNANSWNTWQFTTDAANLFKTFYTFHPIHTSSYDMRAKIKFANYTFAYSNIITVLNGN